jgi:tetratricopeptide (TPR) repeat protein
MRAGGRRWVAVGAVGGALILALAGAAAALFLLRARSAERSLQELLAEVDARIAGGYLSKAEYELESAAAGRLSERGWLRLLKRARQIASATGRYALLAELSGKAERSIPGSGALRQVSRYARLRAGLAAAPDPGQWAGADADLQFLLAEAAQARAPGRAQELAPELAALLEVVQAAPEPGRLSALASRWQDASLLLDAGLLWMAAGQTAQAAAAFARLPEGRTARELRLAAAYDSGAWEQALALAAEDPQPTTDLTLVRADLLRLLKRDPEAAGLYQEVIIRDPRFFWSPYLNLAGMLSEQGQPEAAGELYRKAWELFPDSEEAAAAYVENLARTGADAFAPLAKALERFPESLPLRWLLLEMEREQTGPHRYQAGLRELYEEHPQSPELCRALASHLLALGDAPGAWAVLEQYRGGDHEAAWALELRGLAKALEGKNAEAADWLRRSLESSANGRVRCNLAAVLASAGDQQEAQSELMKSCGELAGRPRLESQARSRLAESLLATGSRPAARREAAYALQLDPGNSRALLILATLEAR